MKKQPRLFKRFVVRALAILGIPLTLALIGFALHKDGFFKIQTVVVSEPNDQDIPEWLRPLWIAEVERLQGLKGQDLMTLKFRDIESEIRQHPWVKEINLSRRWPRTLSVRLGYKHVVAYGRDKKGILFPVLEDSTALPRTPFQAKQDLPLLSVELSGEKPELLQAALAFFKEFPSEGTLTASRISEIGYDSKEGFWTLILPFGTRIKWGESDFQRKISRVQQVIDYLESRQIEARVIDANLAKKVVVRLRKTP